MVRTLIQDAPKKIGKKIQFSGWIHKRRDHGKLIFLDVRDRSGMVQCVVIPNGAKAHAVAKELRHEDIVNLKGLVKERPGSAVHQDDVMGTIEIELEKIEVLNRPTGDLPVDVSQEDMKLNLDTLLNYRTLTLRQEKVRSIFQIYAVLLDAYGAFMRSQDFTEIKSPKILSNATEGGANFFKVKYFDREAVLAQSPQFYKQAGVSAFERVFEVGSVFRAEHHFTSRHVNEYVSLDAEMGFIRGYEDVMDQLEKAIYAIMDKIEKQCPKQLALYGVEMPQKVDIPRMKLTEALQILEKEYKKKIEGVDIDPEGERMIGEYVKKKFNSDFVFLTHYPVKARPFYTMPSEDPQLTKSFDLLFRGLEITTGGQRIHKYEQLVESIKRHNMDPKEFESYLAIFKFGIPPHGGWGMGSERVIQQLLGLPTIKEAVLYPRDVKRLSP